MAESLNFVEYSEQMAMKSALTTMIQTSFVLFVSRKELIQLSFLANTCVYVINAQRIYKDRQESAQYVEIVQ